MHFISNFQAGTVVDKRLCAARDGMSGVSTYAINESEFDDLSRLVLAAGLACAAPFGIDPTHVPFSSVARNQPRS